ncbi:hypothetical protein WSS15_31480 [Acetobacter pasteurianus]|uniref:hypothetical protein n=1 Tax=Acetobacter pasteurianus TaxID=438 RepID=UPI0022CA9C71|nr:hypothetical protein [Acetobacter pasteurianus]GLH30498.1 hypothetical protein WSS15_31480 [Acetobacter pasteurianus]
MSTQALSFAGAMAFLKLNKIVDAGASFLATLDPHTATEADIKQAENHLTEVLTKRACARREYDTANDASSRAKQNYESEVAGLKVLMDKAASAQGDEKLALNAKVNAFEAELQAKKGNVQALLATTKSKKDLVDTYDTIVSAAQDKFKTIQAQGQQAIDRLNIAKEQEAIAKDKAEAQRLGRDGSQGSSFGLRALSAMADKSEIATEVENEKAAAMAPPASMATADADVAAAIAEANGQKPASEKSEAERLADLSL